MVHDPSHERPSLACEASAYVPCIGYDRQQWTVPVRCRRCDPCLRFWRRNVRGRIYSGLQHVDGPWLFVTLTNRKGTCHAQAAANFRSWRHDVARTWNGAPWFRVYEFTRAGTLHIHLLVHASSNLPYVLPGKPKGETESSYKSRQSPAARAFIARVEHHGMGFICEVASVSNERYAPNYLSKYLSKGKQHEIRSKFTGRVRLYGCSRNWAVRTPDPVPTVMGVLRFLPAGDPRPLPSPPGSPYTRTAEWQAMCEFEASCVWARFGRSLDPPDVIYLQSALRDLQHPPVLELVCHCGCETPYSQVDPAFEDRRNSIRQNLAAFCYNHFNVNVTCKVLRHILEKYHDESSEGILE